MPTALLDRPHGPDPSAGGGRVDPLFTNMPSYSTISFSKSGQTLFSPEEVRQLMRVEFDRAQRYRFPISCFLILVDRLEDLSNVHGWEFKEEILQAMIELLKRETRASDFLGCLDGDRLLAVFPHTNAESASFLAERLLKGARALIFSIGERTLRVTLSIGLSNNQQEGQISFDTLLRVAEEGLLVADAGGGDRYVETELYQLYESQRAEQAVAAPALPATEPELAQDDPSRERLLSLVREEGSLEEAAARLADQLVEEALQEIRNERDQLRQELAETQLHRLADLDADKERTYLTEIDQLRRRLSKVSKSLGMTEQELTRLRLLKDVDHGMSSIYREVQGLTGEDPHAEVKQELMQRIFQANLDLRKKTG